MEKYSFLIPFTIPLIQILVLIPPKCAKKWTGNGNHDSLVTGIDPPLDKPPAAAADTRSLARLGSISAMCRSEPHEPANLVRLSGSPNQHSSIYISSIIAMYREEPNKAPQFGSSSGSVNPSCCIGPNLGSLAPSESSGSATSRRESQRPLLRPRFSPHRCDNQGMTRSQILDQRSVIFEIFMKWYSAALFIQSVAMFCYGCC